MGGNGRCGGGGDLGEGGECKGGGLHVQPGLYHCQGPRLSSKKPSLSLSFITVKAMVRGEAKSYEWVVKSTPREANRYPDNFNFNAHETSFLLAFITVKAMVRGEAKSYEWVVKSTPREANRYPGNSNFNANGFVWLFWLILTCKSGQTWQ